MLFPCLLQSQSSDMTVIIRVLDLTQSVIGGCDPGGFAKEHMAQLFSASNTGRENITFKIYSSNAQSTIAYFRYIPDAFSISRASFFLLCAVSFFVVPKGRHWDFRNDLHHCPHHPNKHNVQYILYARVSQCCRCKTHTCNP